MILFGVYFSILLFLIYKNQLFGFFRDEILNDKFFLRAFLVKAIGLLVFYWVYVKLYGSINYSDTYNYFHESKILNSVAHWNFSEYLKLMFGFQNDGPDTELFRNFLRFTTVWDSDDGEWLYNDNRLMLRFHSVVHFISANNYYTHALINLLLGFFGIHWLYKSSRLFFTGKEIYLYLSWLIFPGIWFWSSGLLKEGPVLFFMGMLLVSLTRISNGEWKIKNVMMLVLSILLCFVFKQYILLPLLCATIFYFLVNRLHKSDAQKVFLYVASLTMFLILAGALMKTYKGKSPVNLLYERQKTFLDMSEGGIFLLDSAKFIRLPYDTGLIMLRETRNLTDKYVSIKKGAAFVYCEHSHQTDTLYCESNLDTSSVFQLYYIVPKAGSTIKIKPMENNLWGFVSYIPNALYMTFCKPMFWEIRNSMDLLTLIENAIIWFFLFLFIYYLVMKKQITVQQTYWASICFIVVVIIGITSPNLGAIERYRSPVIPFLLMAALQNAGFTENKRWRYLFKNNPVKQK